MKILIVEDRKVARRQIRVACQRFGYRVVIDEAESVVVAIRLSKSIRESHKDIAFAFLSASMTEVEIELAVFLDVEYVLRKPIQMARVVEVIEAAYGKVRHRSRSVTNTGT